MNMRVPATVMATLLVGACGGPGAVPAGGGAGDKPPDAEFINLLARTNAKIEQFQFSPDGRRIAYASLRNGSSDIWVMNADGTNAHAITDSYPEAETEPQWSPDGQWIAYVTRHCGTGCWSEIFMTKADASTPPINLSYGLGGPNPRWTPDGKSIVFVRYYGNNGFSQIAVLKTDIPYGRPAIRYPTNSPGNEDDPQVSPDGKSLAFTAGRSERANGPRVNGIWVMPLVGGDARLIVESADTPQWSPDSSKIAFVSVKGEWRNIGVVSVASREVKMLTDDQWDDGNPKWSPDGRSVAYVANKKWNLYLMKVAAGGGAPQQLTNQAGVSGGFEGSSAGSNARGTFRWAPDGQSIVYTFMNHGLPPDLWRVPAAGGTPVQLTNSMPDGLSESQFVTPELVSFHVPKAGLKFRRFCTNRSAPKARGSRRCSCPRIPLAAGCSSTGFIHSSSISFRAGLSCWPPRSAAVPGMAGPSRARTGATGEVSISTTRWPASNIWIAKG